MRARRRRVGLIEVLTLLPWCALQPAAAQRPSVAPTLQQALAQAVAVVDTLGPLRGWDSCAAGATGDRCRADASFDSAATVADSENAVAWCRATCANASATGAFDCGNVPNELASQPAAIACGAGMCTAAECCTVVPHREAREQFERALADAPPTSEWLAVLSSIVFEADVSDLAEGSSGRGEFEDGFKTAMARALGDGVTVRAEHIFIDSIQPGSVVVEWHALVPPSVASAASSLVEQLKESGESIEVTTASGLSFDGDTSSIEGPTTEAPQPQPEPGVLPPPGSAPADDEGAAADISEGHFLIGVVGVSLLVCAMTVAWCVVRQGRNRRRTKRTDTAAARSAPTETAAEAELQRLDAEQVPIIPPPLNRRAPVVAADDVAITLIPPQPSAPPAAEVAAAAATEVLIRAPDGRTVAMQVSGTDSVAAIKRDVATQLGLRASECRLIFAGRQLDDACRLGEYNVAHESELHIVLRLHKLDRNETEAAGAAQMRQIDTLTAALKGSKLKDFDVRRKIGGKEVAPGEKKKTLF
jgi:hypothetical protein